jgi:hypothetical protein
MSGSAQRSRSARSGALCVSFPVGSRAQTPLPRNISEVRTDVIAVSKSIADMSDKTVDSRDPSTLDKFDNGLGYGTLRTTDDGVH